MFCNTGLRPVRAVSACCWIFRYGKFRYAFENFSLKETEPGSRNFQLSKAYDMLPVNVIMPEDKEQLALTINGKNVIFIRKNFDTGRILWDSIKFCGTYDEKVCSLKAKLLHR